MAVTPRVSIGRVILSPWGWIVRSPWAWGGVASLVLGFGAAFALSSPAGPLVAILGLVGCITILFGEIVLARYKVEEEQADNIAAVHAEYSRRLMEAARRFAEEVAQREAEQRSRQSESR